MAILNSALIDMTKQRCAFNRGTCFERHIFQPDILQHASLSKGLKQRRTR